MAKSAKRLPPSSSKKKQKADTYATLLKSSLVVLAIALIIGCSQFIKVDPEYTALQRSLTPLNVPKVTSLEQFQGRYGEEMLWGTYRPGMYLGIRAR